MSGFSCGAASAAAPGKGMGTLRPGFPWEAVVLRNVLCEDSRVTLLSGSPP